MLLMICTVIHVFNFCDEKHLSYPCKFELKILTIRFHRKKKTSIEKLCLNLSENVIYFYFIPNPHLDLVHFRALSPFFVRRWVFLYIMQIIKWEPSFISYLCIERRVSLFIIPPYIGGIWRWTHFVFTILLYGQRFSFVNLSVYWIPDCSIETSNNILRLCVVPEVSSS